MREHTNLEKCDGEVHRIHGVHVSSARGTVGEGEDDILPEQSLLRACVCVGEDRTRNKIRKNDKIKNEETHKNKNGGGGGGASDHTTTCGGRRR